MTLTPMTFALGAGLVWGNTSHPDVIFLYRDFTVVPRNGAPRRLGIEGNGECPVIIAKNRVLFARDNAIRALDLGDLGEAGVVTEFRLDELPPDPPQAWGPDATFFQVLSVDDDASRLVSTLSCDPEPCRLVVADLDTGVRWDRPLTRSGIIAAAASAQHGLVFSPLELNGPVIETLDGSLVERIPSPPRSGLFREGVLAQSSIRPDGGAVLVCLDDVGLAIYERLSKRWQVVDPLGQDATWSPDGRYIYYMGMDHTLWCWDSTTGSRRSLVSPTQPSALRAFLPVLSSCGRHLLAGFGQGDAREFLVLDLHSATVGHLARLAALTAAWLPNRS